MGTWKISAHQSGAAKCYVVRKFQYGQPVQSAKFSHDDIDRLRDVMRHAGLRCQPPAIGETPDVVEVWQ
jgi:hypothetical protein